MVSKSQNSPKLLISAIYKCRVIQNYLKVRKIQTNTYSKSVCFVLLLPGRVRGERESLPQSSLQGIEITS